jgi:hypothetical protein
MNLDHVQTVSKERVYNSSPTPISHFFGIERVSTQFLEHCQYNFRWMGDFHNIWS